MQHVFEMRSDRFDNDKSDSNPVRNDFDRDYLRLIGSSSLRRLQAKSQIFGAGSGDYYRTRLTHTLEVAAIAREQAKRLISDQKPNANKGIAYELVSTGNPGLVIDPIVVECASLAHDIGHPPFGHPGEQCLDRRLQLQNLRFEGNAQNFRLLMSLQRRSADSRDDRLREESRFGLNLTHSTLLATNKYPVLLSNEGVVKGTIDDLRKGVYESEWKLINEIRNRWGIPDGARTLECQLMDICDDIAYASHDIEDGIRAGKIKYAELKGAKEGRRASKRLRDGTIEPHVNNPDALFDMEGRTRQRILDAVVDEIEKDVKQGRIQNGLFPWGRQAIIERVEQATFTLIYEWERSADNMGEDAVHASAGLQKSLVRRYTEKLGIIKDDRRANWFKITFVDESGEFEDLDTLAELHVLKRLAYRTIVRDLRVQRLQRRAVRVVEGLWEVFSADPANSPILPPEWKVRFEATSHGEEDWWYRLVADYIAGMTDTYAEHLYRELFGAGGAGSIYEIETD